jgi:hypothetical protein
MEGATVVGIRYDCHNDDGSIASTNIVLIAELSDTLEDIANEISAMYFNTVYLLGYVETPEKDEVLYDDTVTIGSIHKPGMILVYANVPLPNDLK